MRVRPTPLYLFACHLEWRDMRKLEAYKELLAALDDHDEDIRRLAELLLHRSSPRPRAKSGNSLANRVASRRRFERVRQYSRTD
jgi:hypothetical protein